MQPIFKFFSYKEYLVLFLSKGILGNTCLRLNSLFRLFKYFVNVFLFVCLFISTALGAWVGKAIIIISVMETDIKLLFYCSSNNNTFGRMSSYNLGLKCNDESLQSLLSRQYFLLERILTLHQIKIVKMNDKNISQF